MNKFKFIVDENGKFTGYGKNGTVEFDSEFNQTNIPSEYHYHDGEKWVEDKDLKIAVLTKEVQEARSVLYDIGLQVGALMKQVNYDRLQGKELIQELDDALGHVQSVKNANPLPDTEE